MRELSEEILEEPIEEPSEEALEEPEEAPYHLEPALDVRLFRLPGRRHALLKPPVLAGEERWRAQLHIHLQG